MATIVAATPAPVTLISVRPISIRGSTAIIKAIPSIGKPRADKTTAAAMVAIPGTPALIN